MKRLFEIIGLLSLVMFSFFMTNKTATVVKNMDDIMVQIKNNDQKYRKDSVDAVIKEDTIIPGISGQKVNVNESYKAMREYGKYNEDLYVYDYIKPKISIENHKDKYIISGNQQLRQVSLVFILKENSNIKNILDILDNNSIKGSFFVNEEWVTNNNYTVIDLIETGYTIGVNGSDEYSNWIDTIIKNVGKQKQGYCLYQDQKKNNCYKLNNYTIKAEIYSRNYFLNIQRNIHNGSIFIFKDNTELYKELDSIIKYIKSKGYDIVTLEKILTE